VYENKRRYEGKVKNYVPHGQGTLYNSDGSVKYRGEWINGKPEEMCAE